jgi:hypothetical protein
MVAVPIKHEILGKESALAEHAYLVARGVRHIAEVGTIPKKRLEMLRAMTQLETIAPEGAVPFVCPTRDGFAKCGFASSQWALELFKWTLTSQIPKKQRSRILGLLFGYSREAVRDFEDRACGRLWQAS